MRTSQTQTIRSARSLAFMVPLILVNLGALVGQTLWAYDQLANPDRPWTLWGWVAAAISLVFGIALESISMYLSLQAHAALMADQASGGLRIAAYGVGAVMAGLNYSHFDSIDAPELGIVCGLFSLASPWLWALDSKAAARAQLAARGIVDPRGVKLSTNRKLWHPLRSLGVVRHAAWAGETNPELAVSGWEQSRETETRAALKTLGFTEPITVETVPAPPAIETADRLEIETPSGLMRMEMVETETVTETITRTRQTRSRETAMETLATRVEAVKSHPLFQAPEPLNYDTIGEILGITGRATIAQVYGVLYRGVAIEDAVRRNG